MDIFSSTNYRKLLKELVEKTDQKGWGAVTRLADATGCQRSHLSRVLNGQSDLTLEQGYAVARFFTLNDEETDYLILLIQTERSTGTEYQGHLRRRIEKIQRDRAELAKRLKRDDNIQHELAAFYYSAWHWSAIHIASSIGNGLTIDEFQARLKLPRELIQQALPKLADFGLIEKEGQRWKFKSGTTHLGKGSPYLPMHHQNWKVQAVVDSQNQETRGVHYTVVHTMSEETFAELKSRILKMIDEYNALAGPSSPDKLVAFGMDLFPFDS